MPVFTKQLDKVNQNPQVALKQMENHIRYIQEQLEYTLSNLDSTNITEIETDKTNITSSDGTLNLSSDALALSGTNGESFKAGNNSTSKKFTFELKGKNGTQFIYLNDNGNLIITKNTTLSVDCGEW